MGVNGFESPSALISILIVHSHAQCYFPVTSSPVALRTNSLYIHIYTNIHRPIS